MYMYRKDLKFCYYIYSTTYLSNFVRYKQVVIPTKLIFIINYL